MHRRAAWFSLGTLALVLGAIGVVLPLLPTTPFVLLAAYAFAQSSERAHNWLLRHRLFGPMIDDWRAYGAIRRRAKILAVASMLVIVGLSLLADIPSTLLALQLVALSLTATFIVTRPEPPGAESYTGQAEQQQEKSSEQ